MFKLFKKREKYDGIIKAVHEMMENQAPAEKRPPMSMDALTHRLVRKYHSVEEAEKEHMVSDPRICNQPVPFGFSNSAWRELLSEMRKGDELWAFTTSDESWDNLAGRAGISLVRNGKEISCIVTMMS